MANCEVLIAVALSASALGFGGTFSDQSGMNSADGAPLVANAAAANGENPIEPRRSLITGPVLFYPTGPDGMYAPGLFQDRYLADGTRAAAILSHDPGAYGATTFWLDNTNSNPGDGVINATFFKWEVTPVAGHEADATMILTIDLCHYARDTVASLPISRVNVGWASPRTMPTTWKVEGSLDNASYFPLMPEQPTDNVNRESFAGTTAAIFAPANVRYLRITGAAPACAANS